MMSSSTDTITAEDRKIWDEIVKKGVLNAITGYPAWSGGILS
jgi:hypothetical protein